MRMKVNRKEVGMKDGSQPSLPTNNCHNNFTYSLNLKMRTRKGSLNVKMLKWSVPVFGFMVAVCVGILGSIPLVSAAPDLTLDAEDRFQEELVESDFDSELYAGGGGEIPGDGIFSEGKFQLSPDDIQVHQHKIPNSEDMSSLDSNNPLFPNGDNVVEQQEEKERMEEKDVFAGSDKVPDKPSNLSVAWVTDSMMELSWSEPLKPNGKLEGYRIFYMQNNFTDVVTVKSPTEHMKFALMNLAAYTEYTIWLKAFTWKNEGESSATIVVKTDVRGPFPPRIVNVSCLSEDALYIAWNRPTKFYNTIDFYYVDYRSDQWRDFEELTVNAHADQPDHSITLQNLTTNVMYEIRVRGGTRSVLETDKVFKGQYSDSKRILLQQNCEKTRTVTPLRSVTEFTPQVIAIAICASFVLILMLIALVIWRRCFQGAYYYLDDPPRIPPLVGGTGWDGDTNDELKRAIPAHLFSKHVSELHVDGDIGFSKEYELIQSCSVQDDFSSEHSQHPDNKQKNRYLNIVAYDHTRVRLQPMPGQKKCIDYINANYIDGFRNAQAYIGTQGPLPSTFDCFWRMVWEHNVHIIVMITNLVERGRKKCDMYWPKEGIETYGVIQVRLVKEEVMATYIVRTFQLKHLKLGGNKNKLCKFRSCQVYHYTNWPDHGTPSHPLPVLSFVKKSAAANPVDGGPIIVHCSAGVGRTGTYIEKLQFNRYIHLIFPTVLDAMLRQVQSRGDLNIFGFLNHIRTQRNFLVQTEEQYIFIHDALLEGIESGETNVNKTYLSRYLHSLLSSSYADEKSEVSSLLERQYKLVTQFTPKDFNLASALKASNLTKNRNLDCVCTDTYRVALTPKPGVEGSDYINASFFPGYHRLQEFIITQHPLEATTPEFWQMLWDHNVQMVVVLSVIDNQEYGTFWPPQGEDMDFDTFRVKLVQESDQGCFIIRDFSIQSLQDDYELSIKMVQCSHWPHTMISPSSAVFELVTFTQESLRESSSGPIAVLDRFGGTEAATFCTLTTLVKQMNLESHIDVYMYAKLYHEQRPGVWKNLDDYLFLYRCMEALTCTSNGIPHTPTSPSPLLPPSGTDPFITTTPNILPPNGHMNGRIIHNGNGTVRVPPDGMETVDHSGDPMV
ncbi:Tyrosine-protein phosphatase 99A [Folsomia candida]|uniref:Tyrosine-protein phosphatase 99A n=1 Tax=Folsomia candida TaxID=158441 RepID=A0A226E7E2_FOLCA|nr:Tyrosine-protein phosphatase 99A [Folsomia candida]